MFHCVSNYPTQPQEAMLWMIPKLKNELGVRIGFSDHTLGIEVPVKAAALGAEVIEKHFTTDKTLPGPDHAIAADPAELRALVEALRGVVPGSLPAPPEEAIAARPDAAKKPVMRRGVYAARDIKMGETVTLDMLALVRPEVTPLEKLPKIVGKPASRDFTARDAVTP
ncbi:MAG: N-acetylneuraminate synthase family protein [Nitrospinae bacterium]|nr:N-acetylneuraminate synthase family protein [Nitrospinota bacterium]